jgi:hypothetical protein
VTRTSTLLVHDFDEQLPAPPRYDKRIVDRQRGDVRFPEPALNGQTDLGIDPLQPEPHSGSVEWHKHRMRRFECRSEPFGVVPSLTTVWQLQIAANAQERCFHAVGIQKTLNARLTSARSKPQPMV